MSKRIKKQSSTSVNASDVFGMIMTIFTIVVLCIFPLAYDDFYFNILETKYQFYCVAAISMMVVMVVYGLLSKRIQSFVKVVCSKEISFKDILKKMSMQDWAILAFWLANVISWLICDWRWEAFWGTSGRYNGVFLMTIYTVVYFLVTRFYTLKRWHLDAFLVVSIFVCLFGITDYFQMDLLGFKERMVPGQRHSYTSTFGNINTYTVYVGAVTCTSMILFVFEQNHKKMLWYYAVMALSMVALIIGASDNIYLMLATLFGISPLLLFKTRNGLGKYLVSLATFFTAVLFVGWIARLYSGKVLGIYGIFSILNGLSWFPVVVCILWIATGILRVASVKKKEDLNNVGIWSARLWILVIVAVIAAVGFVLYDANMAGNAERYGKIGNYVVFNDDWGSGRGYVWIRSMQLYQYLFSMPQKLFGYGADTLAILMNQFFEPQNGVYFDSVHNEYLHFLVTTGLVGMTSYIIFLIACIVKMVKNLKGRPEVAAILFVTLAYMVQATVNINLPVVIPLIYQLVFMGLAKKAEMID